MSYVGKVTSVLHYSNILYFYIIVWLYFLEWGWPRWGWFFLWWPSCLAADIVRTDWEAYIAFIPIKLIL